MLDELAMLFIVFNSILILLWLPALCRWLLIKVCRLVRYVMFNWKDEIGGLVFAIAIFVTVVLKFELLV